MQWVVACLLTMCFQSGVKPRGGAKVGVFLNGYFGTLLDFVVFFGPQGSMYLVACSEQNFQHPARVKYIVVLAEINQGAHPRNMKTMIMSMRGIRKTKREIIIQELRILPSETQSAHPPPFLHIVQVNRKSVWAMVVDGPELHGSNGKRNKPRQHVAFCPRLTDRIHKKGM